MDPLSQAAIGAVAAQSAANRAKLKAATLAGALGGMAPDLDVLIRSSSDPLLSLEFHRHFTHSLLFIPIGGPLVGWLVWILFFKRRNSRTATASASPLTPALAPASPSESELGSGPVPVPESLSRPAATSVLTLREAMIFATLGFATHGFLDACTSYGTQLLWPFSNLRVAWNNVGIVDPVPTFSWLLAAIGAVLLSRVGLARIGFGVGLAYLALGVLQRERASSVQNSILTERGHVAERAEVKPTVLQLFLWRSIYEYEGRYYVDAIRVGFGTSKVYPGESVAKFSADVSAHVSAHISAGPSTDPSMDLPVTSSPKLSPSHSGVSDEQLTGASSRVAAIRSLGTSLAAPAAKPVGAPVEPSVNTISGAPASLSQSHPVSTSKPLSKSFAPDSVQARDIRRFEWFSDGWVSAHPNVPGALGDVRYALLPNAIHPLWGIRINPQTPDQHVQFESFRNPSEETWASFVAMIRGE